MPLENARELFIFNIGELRDMEVTSGRLLSAMADRVQSADLADALRELAQDSRKDLEHIDASLRVLGTSSMSMQSPIVECMQATFQRMSGIHPSVEAFDLFAADLARRYVSYAATSYQHMTDWAQLMGEIECAQHLRLNGMRKSEWTSRLEDTGYQLAKTLIADQAGRGD